ncbi:MAG: division/cell wall cluster transcriptional repressor MraZ [Acidimicrobiia bacterium]|nr:division/cell wall cluster transcriptional repressor MraZ [Acidimicrobiia bacterium]NNL26901.1 division/cell wall cluster transcriptional repressor MraZ [Acidimicrobiia bacterium]
MFVGEYAHALDGKGRLVLPSRFRDDLASGCYLTKGQERCLYVFDEQQFDREVERVRSIPRADRSYRTYARVFFSGASDQQLDKQGRIQIPAGLRAYASLNKDVAILGVGERIEIWDSETWAAYLAGEADQFYSDISEDTSRGGGGSQ